MHVVVHNAVSVDGRIDGFVPDIALYYDLVGTWDVDAHLTGADTLIEGEGTASDDPEGGADPPSEAADEEEWDEPPLLVVTDSRGRVTGWERIRNSPYWRDVLVLCSEATPSEYLTGLEEAAMPYVVNGQDHVDLEAAMDTLADRNVETVLVDSGGTLSGALLRAGLVDEVSVLVHPTLVGGTSARSFVRGPDPTDRATTLEVIDIERPAEDVVWLRYAVPE